MKFQIKKSFSGREIPKTIKFTYDKTSSKRPAWVYIKNLPKNVMFLSTRANGKIHHYRIYLSTTIPLFLPTNYTKEEMERFYDKFAQIYDNEVESRNSRATKFLFDKIKLPKNSKILDLGAGSGISSVPLVKMGYENITLLDFSEGMLAKAKQKKELKNCKFIKQDVTKLKFKERYDLIFSIFSFASSSYFDDKEMPKLWKNVITLLKPKGILMLMGNDFEPPKNLTKKIKSGKYKIISGYKAQWYIEKKK